MASGGPAGGGTDQVTVHATSGRNAKFREDRPHDAAGTLLAADEPPEEVNVTYPQPEVSREITGEPIVVGERTIRPVARVSTRLLNFQVRGGGVAGVGLRISPSEAIVREKDGTEYRIALADPTAKMMRAMMVVALLAPLGYIFLRLSRRTRSQEVRK